MNPLQK